MIVASALKRSIVPVTPARPTDDLELAGLLAAHVGLTIDLAVAVDLDVEHFGQRAHAADADAVQAAGHLVAVLVELAAGVQLGQDHLERGLAALVHVDGDAAAVVLDRDRAVLVDAHIDAVGLAGERLVDGVVDHLPDEVVQPLHAGVADVHRRALAHGIEAFEDLDGTGVVAFFGGVLFRHVPCLPVGMSTGRWVAQEGVG
jgi:hypothetical protein